jgi:D-alanyl-D-alanine carboxypeptidase/D-alanyl-D-alanine-endopeptidase (penicillin-binding protein 4)
MHQTDGQETIAMQTKHPQGLRHCQRRMLAGLAMVGLSWAQPALAQVAPKSRCLADLAPAIAQLQQDPRWDRSHWGMVARTLDPTNPQTLISLDERRLFVPASNTKLFSTAAALTALGPTFRSPTRAYWQPRAYWQRGTAQIQVRPAWVIVPGGDPSLTSDRLRAWADQLAQLHPPREPMDVVVFDRAETPPSWEWDDLIYGYAPVVNQAIVDRNAVQLTLSPSPEGLQVKPATGLSSLIEWFRPSGFRALPAGAAPTWRVTLDRGTGMVLFSGGIPTGQSVQLTLAYPQPAQQFAWIIADRLSGRFFELRPPDQAVSPAPVRRPDASTNPWQVPVFQPPTVPQYDHDRNLPVAYQVRSLPLPDHLGEPTALLDSPPLAEIVTTTNQASDNLAAEVLLRWLDPDRPLDRLRQILTELGVNPQSYHLMDGSGLSRQNLVSPEAVVQLLAAMARSPHAQIYRESLPLAGQSGTLANRFTNTPLAGRLRAKTGTLTGVVSLAGYWDHPEWGPIAFSIMVDRATASSADLRPAIDQVIGWLDEARSCP